MIYRFADCELDTERYELHACGVSKPVEPQVFDLLRYLVENRDRTITKEELYKAIWQERIVSESALSSRIKAARQAVGDNGHEQKIIRTLHGRGFQFLARVETDDGEHLDHSAESRPSIAVLPFENLSGDPEQDYFAEGLAQDIITELSREPDLFVIAHNSSFVYKDRAKDIREIGRDLGARYVVEGSVRKAGDRIRLTARLINTETNRNIWSERYDRSIEDIFAVQDELTSAVYSTLLKKLVDFGFEQTARKKPTDLDAYSHVLRAFGLMFRMPRTDILAAFDAAEAALAIDPHYSRAHTAMAYAHLYRVLLGQVDDPKQALETARVEAQKAIEADRNDYWSYGALGAAEIWMNHHERAQLALERAVALGPNSADMRALNALVVNFLGRPEEGLADIELATRLNPNHPDWYIPIWGRSLYLLGRHDEAIAVLQRLAGSRAELLPMPSSLLLIANYMAKGRSNDARDLVAALLEVNPNFTLAQVPQFAPFKKDGDRDRFLDLLRRAGLPE